MVMGMTLLVALLSWTVFVSDRWNSGIARRLGRLAGWRVGVRNAKRVVGQGSLACVPGDGLGPLYLYMYAPGDDGAFVRGWREAGS